MAHCNILYGAITYFVRRNMIVLFGDVQNPKRTLSAAGAAQAEVADHARGHGGLLALPRRDASAEGLQEGGPDADSVPGGLRADRAGLCKVALRRRGLSRTFYRVKFSDIKFTGREPGRFAS